MLIKRFVLNYFVYVYVYVYVNGVTLNLYALLICINVCNVLVNKHYNTAILFWYLFRNVVFWFMTTEAFLIGTQRAGYNKGIGNLFRIGASGTLILGNAYLRNLKSLNSLSLLLTACLELCHFLSLMLGGLRLCLSFPICIFDRGLDLFYCVWVFRRWWS